MAKIIRGIIAAIYLGFLSLTGFAQGVPLTDLAPQSIRTAGAGHRGNAIPTTLQLADGTYPALRFVTDAEISWAIPPGQQSFTAVLAYDTADNNLKNLSGETIKNQLYVRFKLDGRTVLEACLDEWTPPQKLAIPLAAGQVLTVSGKSHFGGGAFYLAEGKFQGVNLGRAQARYQPAPGGAYVDVFPLPRQALFHLFRPGEVVPVGVYFSGEAAQAEVRLQVNSQQAEPFHVPLENGAGRATWRVPEVRGPGQLQIEAQIGGKRVFERSLGIAITPQVDLARFRDSIFGLNTSWNTRAAVQDEFASLWGAKWDRILLDWGTMESTPGTYDFSEADDFVNAMLAQHMNILAMIGERSPEWAGLPGPPYDAAWAAFVREVVRHFHRKVQYWDLFNEPNSKLRHWAKQGLRDPDLPLLKAGLAAVREADPQAIIVCCSSQVSDWLPYDKRLFDAGLLRDIDIVSMHAYPHGPPEEKEGFLTSLEAFDKLDELVRSYGSRKPIWNTESNWLLAPEGGPETRNSHVTEHDQAEFVVRVSLLDFARGAHFFVHSPFYSWIRRQLLLDTLAAYSNMAAMFTGAKGAVLLNPSPGIYGVVAEQEGHSVGALWTVDCEAKLALSGLETFQFFDFYGNRIAEPVLYTPQPVYFSGLPNSTPRISVLSQTPIRAQQWKPLPDIASWGRSNVSQYSERNGILHVISDTATYGTLLLSPAFAVQPSTCYMFSANARVFRGLVEVSAIDSATGTHRGVYLPLSWIPGEGLSRMFFRFYSGPSNELKLKIQASDDMAETPELEISEPQIAECASSPM